MGGNTHQDNQTDYPIRIYSVAFHSLLNIQIYIIVERNGINTYNKNIELDNLFDYPGVYLHPSADTFIFDIHVHQKLFHCVLLRKS